MRAAELRTVDPYITQRLSTTSMMFWYGIGGRQEMVNLLPHGLVDKSITFMDSSTQPCGARVTIYPTD